VVIPFLTNFLWVISFKIWPGALANKQT